MRRRLYVMCPDLEAAQQTMNDLLLARIEERHIHCLSKPCAPMAGLHEANILQKTDFVHGAELGLIIGGVGGMILGAIIVLAPPGGVPLHMMAILLMTLGGALFGAWAASLAASSVPNTRLLAFAKDIEEGKYLMMVDVPFHRVNEIRELLEKRHPEDVSGGIEPTTPAFP